MGGLRIGIMLRKGHFPKTGVVITGSSEDSFVIEGHRRCRVLKNRFATNSCELRHRDENFVEFGDNVSKCGAVG